MNALQYMPAVRSIGRPRIPRWARRAQAVVGLTLMAVVVVIALVGPLLAPHAIDAPVGAPGASPSSSALLGTDFLGRDVLSRALHGGVSVITTTMLAVALTYLLGTGIGLVAGFSRSLLDPLLMRSVDLVMGFPPLLLLLVLIAGAGRSRVVVVLGVAAVLAAPLARLVYSATLEAAALPYIEAAVIRGERRTAILVREILPNIAPYIIASFGTYVSGAVIFTASLNFLGIGTQPPAADWGLMVSENQPVIATNVWAVLAPAVMLGLITVGVNLVGDAYARASGMSSEAVR